MFRFLNMQSSSDKTAPDAVSTLISFTAAIVYNS